MTNAALRLVVAVACCACSPEFALQRPTTVRCDCQCNRTPCDEVLLCVEPELESLSTPDAGTEGNP